MSQDYTVAKELASLKEIKETAEQRISDLSLNALNYVNDHRLHKAGGGSDPGFPWVAVLEASVVLDTETGSEEYMVSEKLYSDFDLALKRDGQIVAMREQPVLLAIITDQNGDTRYVELSGELVQDQSGVYLRAQLPDTDTYIRWEKVGGEESMYTLP